MGRLLEAAFAEQEDPTALGLVRILVVTIMTLSALTHVGALTEYFSADAEVGGEFARLAYPSRFSLFFYAHEPWMVRAIFALGIAAHVFWIVGLYTRVAAVASWLLWISMAGRMPLLYAYPDQLGQVMVFLLMLMPTGRGLSLDARWRGKGGPVPVWCRRILQLQLAIMYTATGLAKTGKTWMEGTAIYYSALNPYNRHFDLGPLMAIIQPWVLRPMTYLVLVWEVAFGGFVVVLWAREIVTSLRGHAPRWLPDLRRPALGFGVAMHFGIWALLYVVFFTPLVVSSYSCFLRPDEAKRLIARLQRRFTKRASASA